MPSGVRKPWVGGNWKCNGTLKSLEELCEKFNAGPFDKKQLDVVICPSPVHLSTIKRLLGDKIDVGSQNVSKTGNGAFTGETSCEILMDMGIKWSLVGHSERRQFYGETDQVVADKVDYVLNKATTINEIKPNLAVCIGELLSEREAGKTVEVCTRQMKAFIPKVKDWNRVVIAYEPVWAIGTGKVATPEQAQEAHEAIRKLVSAEVSKEVADSIRIVYGGSVTDANSASLISQQDIDGFLVGGASLKTGFLDIIDSVVKQNATSAAV
eukprot:GHVS01013421.1.p1 GENE.GHVS01013421.1~~GHVS01013421.1.p1  ORF type:complete len:268 (-),score=34.76 GHVS01013421.1:233-1036(-)